MIKSARPHLLLVLQALDHIERYRPETGQEFLESQMIQDAILMRLQQAGENLIKVRDLDPEAFEHRPESWRRVIGLRHIISHGYDAVEPDVIWHIISDEIEAFRSTIEAVLAESPPD